MQAIVMSIGDELVLGQTVDTNTAYLSARLARLGISTRYHHTAADDLEDIARAIVHASEQADLLLISGGLGPTEDDLTRQALAMAMDQVLETDEESIAMIEAYFQSRDREMPERNRVQALLPHGAKPVVNHHGTAPGIHAKLTRADIFVMPGVPREMKRMFEEQIEPRIQAQAGRGVILTTKINTFGTGESDIGQTLGSLMDRQRNPKVGTTVANGICSVRLRSEFPSKQDAQSALDKTIEQVEQQLGPIVFGRDETTLPEAVIHLLVKHGLTVCVAESCTGGLLGASLTDISGASEVFAGGMLTYANELKRDLLGVSQNFLDKYGAVSPQVAGAMARGVIERCGGDIGVSVTGIAGPGGGTPEKPVGTVYVGLALREDDENPSVLHLTLKGDRQAVRDRTTKCALQMIRLRVMGESLSHIAWGRDVSKVVASAQNKLGFAQEDED